MKKIYSVRDTIPGIPGKITMVAIAVGAVIAAVQVAWFCMFFSILPVLVLVSYRGVEIDLAQHRFRPFLSVMGFKSGQISQMPPIRYVLIKDTLFVYRSNRYGTVTTDDTYEVALICEDHVKIPLLYSYDIPEILSFAMQEKRTFNCHIEDLTKEQIAKNINKE